MSNWLRKLVIVAILCCLSFIQPIQSIVTINKTPTLKLVITASQYSSDISVAEITAPTTFPILDERKADSTFLNLGEITFVPISHVSYEPPQKFSLESTGFLYVRQYQSSYLSKHI